MSTLSGQGNLNELTQQVNSVTENLTTADQQLNSQSPAPYVEVEAGSVAHSEYYIWKRIIELSEDEQLLNPEQGLEPGSMAQTEDMNPYWESSPTAMSFLGEGEGNPNANELPRQFNSHDNSQRDVEEGFRCLGPNTSHLDHAGQASNGRSPTLEEKGKSQVPDHAGTSAEACIGKKRKARGPIILTEEQEVEKKKKKREADKKYRAGLRTELNGLRSMKSQYDGLMERVSRFEGIDEIESQINQSNGMESELLRLQQKEVDYDMFRQLVEPELHRLGKMKSKYGGIEEMESMLDRFKEMEDESHRLKLMKSKYGEIEELESMLDKFKEKEAEFHKLDQMKSKFGGIQEIESILDKFKEMEAESHRLKLIKSKYGEIEELESMLDKFKEMEAESHKLDQIKSKLGAIQETESIVDKFKEMEAELHRFDQIKLSFGGIHQIESAINRLKNIELQLEKYKEMVNQKELESIQASPGSRQYFAAFDMIQQMEIDESYRQQQKEADFHRFEQMKSKPGGTNEMELKLDKFHEMEAEINRLKKIECN